jgi:hypothetical protein
VVVAVSAVRMVQMAIHQVINMVAMRHGFVAAVGTMSVRLLGGTAIVRSTFLRVRCAHFNLMIVHMIAVGVMQVAIVKIIGVAVVLHGGVPAVWAMHVAMGSRMFLVSVGHCFSPLNARLHSVLKDSLNLKPAPFPIPSFFLAAAVRTACDLTTARKGKTMTSMLPFAPIFPEKY